MRKFLRPFSMIAIALVMIGSFGVPQTTQAQGANPLQTGPTAVGTGLAQQNAEKVVKAQDGCSFTSPSSWVFECFYGGLGKLVWGVIIPLTGWLLWLIGQMLDFALNLQLTSDFFKSPAINAGWTIIRDLCNMVFIFVLIYAGISTILNLSSANLKKVITGVIISALLINFSLYITRAIIDVSNVATTWFVQGVKNVGGGVGVSDSVQGILQMEKLIKSDAKPTDGTPIGLTTFVTGLAVLGLNFVAIYVFFSVAFLFIARIVSFMFLLVTAPIGFVKGLGIGDLDDLASKWWKELRSQAIMAPMFFLMLYLTLYMVDQVQTLVFTAGAGKTDAVLKNNFSPANYLMFAIIVMMLLKCLEVAKTYSGELGDKIAGGLKGALGIVSGAALGVATGGAAMVGRQVIGRTAFNAMQNDDRMKNLQTNAAKGIFSVSGNMARLQLAGLNKAANSSYDARQTSAVGGLAKNLAKSSVAGYSVDASKVNKTVEKGYKGSYEAYEKSEKEWAEKNLGKGKAGEVNRMNYAANRKWDEDAWYFKGMQSIPVLRQISGKNLGMGATNKAMGGINDAAYKAYTKSEKEGAEKDAQKIKNLIIDNQIAADILKGSLAKNDGGAIDDAADNASESLDTYMKKRMKDSASDRAKLLSKADELEKEYQELYDRGDYDAANESRARVSEDMYKAINEAKKHATKEDYEAAKKLGVVTNEDAEKTGDKYLSGVVAAQKQVEEAKAHLEAAKTEKSLMAKKAAIDKARAKIEDDIIGKEGKVDKNGDYIEGKQGKGLKEELRKKKAEAKAKKDESRTIGSEGGGGGGGSKDDDNDDGDDDKGKKK